MLSEQNLVTLISVHPPLLHHLGFIIGSQGLALSNSLLPPLHQSLLTAVGAQPGRSIQPSRWPALSPQLAHLPYKIIPREDQVFSGTRVQGVGVGGAAALCRTLPPVSRFWGCFKNLRVQMGPANHGTRDCQPQEKHALLL